MGVNIYYFSGTGNSLVVARDIASKLDGNLISLASVMDKELKNDADIIGIVFPVHFSAINGVPCIVQRFVKKLENMNSKYIFAVCTCGGFSAATIENLGKIIKSNGANLAAGFTVQMPSNIEEVSKEEQKKLFDMWNNKLGFVCEYVTAKNRGEFESTGFFLKLILSPIFAYYRTKILNFFKKISKSPDSSLEELVWLSDKRFFTDDNCEGCGTCARVCPVHNIQIIKERPQWQHHCEICLACLNWCPNGAIHGEWISKEVRYHNPNVKLSNILREY